jgi:hypothetical protein
LSFSENRDVVIKVVAKGHEGLRELKILELLNVEPLKSDPANATAPIVEFLHYHDWHFVVMPFCDGSDEKPFLNAMECLEFADQVLSVSLSTTFCTFLDCSFPFSARIGSVFFTQ